MALGEDIIARIGLDNRPFQKGLRGLSGHVAGARKELNQQFASFGKGLITALGIHGAINGFKNLVSAAREAKETGEEAINGIKMSPQTIAVLSTISEFWERISNAVETVAAKVVGTTGKFVRFLTAFAMTGSFAKANEIVKEMANEEERALEVARERKRIQDSTLIADEEELAIATLIAEAEEKRLKLAKATGEEHKKLTAELRNQEVELARRKMDRGKFTLQELAESPLRFSGRLGSEQQTARQVAGLEQRAEFLRQRGFADPALQLLNRADELRKGLTNVVDADRFPFKSMEKGISETALAIGAIKAEMDAGGVPIKAKMSR